MDFLKAQGTRLETHPPQSPDLNVIEVTIQSIVCESWVHIQLAWAHLKHRLFAQYTPTTVAELKEAASRVWEELTTLEYCRKLIMHMQVMLPQVIESEGKPVHT